MIWCVINKRGTALSHNAGFFDVLKAYLSLLITHCPRPFPCISVLWKFYSAYQLFVIWYSLFKHCCFSGHNCFAEKTTSSSGGLLKQHLIKHTLKDVCTSLFSSIFSDVTLSGTRLWVWPGALNTPVQIEEAELIASVTLWERRRSEIRGLSL